MIGEEAIPWKLCPVEKFAKLKLRNNKVTDQDDTRVHEIPVRRSANSFFHPFLKKRLDHTSTERGSTERGSIERVNDCNDCDDRDDRDDRDDHDDATTTIVEKVDRPEEGISTFSGITHMSTDQKSRTALCTMCPFLNGEREKKENLSI
ncbi:hypothetical protein POVWA2_057150 [Plasmodium ovale wallikeri]|uniref:Uncharacterized protein n=1 Tax=Plasmodium ovale wallikeri TaxID=864142 RepID=A0A1A8ZXA8_PLAOA|nr:hypothetical protein POVWA1_057800 [Plasmodium ovale wallikeri]SBT48961.1 hypothetical protein POVWA2_057150 [Plasmodium ovale wallikeri]